jgi:aminoglycoside phosphotransferase (APT) family kinase protein
MSGSSFTEKATAVACGFADSAVRSISRFSRGHHHHVYDVTCADGRAFVVRIGAVDDRAFFEAARGWHALLAPIGAPLPRILASGVHLGHPFLIVERLPGVDLEDALDSMSRDDRRALADAISAIQERVQERLPEGHGFGDALSYDGPYTAASWAGAVEAFIERSRRRLAGREADMVELIRRAEAGAVTLAPYFASVRPRPFLDDITTKNVIIHERRLSGIVDVDWLCFGDRLMPVALTRNSMLSTGRDPDYADFWLEAHRPGADERRAFRFYTALYALDFIGEHGHVLNRDERVRVEDERLARLHGILVDELDAAQV